MVSFNNDLLTILVLICISWAGLTCIVAFIIIIFLLCKKCRHTTPVSPIRTPSISSSVSITNHSPLISRVPTKYPIINGDRNQKLEPQRRPYNTMDSINEHSFSPRNVKNKYPDEEEEDYRYNKGNETIRTIDESRVYDQRHQKRQYQLQKPVGNIRVLDRNTPYPPDVIARDKLMHNNRYTMDDKF
ncbi:unnamed protein product [Adineta steineri]|uniref:Uncharacterized protein n=1 Tax=Adineta steineri TaxID=433720 RepID=A0A813N7R7_9BILA|nr:unnamed protein product [Adineta steineri]CAF0735011.1 unnamed protein product [Adineta steineri]CAF3550722.1 unnamed protein product [Adineta steineri]